MSLARKYKQLYRLVPPMQCKPGCHDCCSGITATPYERSLLPKHDIDPNFLSHLKCPYLGKLGCAVYELRPFVCRVYGTVPGLPCLHGCAPIVPLNKEEEERLRAVYRALNLREGGKKMEFI